jgi:uncharacterized membrane protein YgdD (TMEM256/DUF423 family)
MTIEKKLIATGVVFGGLAVVAGAFGAHGLKSLLPADQLQAYDTAVRYQFYHGLALISTGLLIKNFNSKNFSRAGICFITGTILFSGSLYVLSTYALLNLQLNWIGIITPIGGLLMITGWILLLIGILRSSP